MKLITSQKLRRRVQHDCSEPKVTDQSHQKSADINIIVQQFLKTGYLQPPAQPPIYADLIGMPSLGQAHTALQDAKTAFLRLPSSIRANMGHDYKNLENWLKDAKNWKTAEKHGLLSIKQEVRANPSPNPTKKPAKKEEQAE